MTLKLASRKLYLRLPLLFILGTASLLAVGTKSVTSELQRRPAERLAFRHSLTAWNQILLLELPFSQRQEWNQVTQNQPELLLQVCSIAEPTPSRTQLTQREACEQYCAK
jgi:hypothetical protein